MDRFVEAALALPPNQSLRILLINDKLKGRADTDMAGVVLLKSNEMKEALIAGIRKIRPDAPEIELVVVGALFIADQSPQGQEELVAEGLASGKIVSLAKFRGIPGKRLDLVEAPAAARLRAASPKTSAARKQHHRCLREVLAWQRSSRRPSPHFARRPVYGRPSVPA